MTTQLQLIYYYYYYYYYYYWKLCVSIGQPVNKSTKFQISLDFARPNNNNCVLQHSLHDPSARCVSHIGQSKHTRTPLLGEDLPVNTAKQHLGQTNSPCPVHSSASKFTVGWVIPMQGVFPILAKASKQETTTR